MLLLLLLLLLLRMVVVVVVKMLLLTFDLRISVLRVCHGKLRSLHSLGTHLQLLRLHLLLQQLLLAGAEARVAARSSSAASLHYIKSQSYT